MNKNSTNETDLVKIDVPNSNSENLERIRFRLLEQFRELMQLNTYIHNFGKNSELLIDKIMKDSIDLLQSQYQYAEKSNLKFFKKLTKSYERNRETFKLLYEEQEHCWKKNKLSTQTAMLNFNELTREIAVILETLEHYSMHDPLTQLHNRRYFNAIIAYEVSRSERHKHTFCLLMMDLDNFKQINDTYGHFSGDEMLRQFADLLRMRLRKNDVVARIGGDEFSILLTETSAVNGLELAKTLVKTVVENTFTDSQGHTFQVSVSIGVANYPQDAQTLDILNNAADAALYSAKNAGKNQVVDYKTIK